MGNPIESRYGKPYTKEEDRIIRLFYPARDAKTLVDQLKGRNENSIRIRASRLSTKRKGLPYFTTQKIAQLLEVKTYTVRMWIYRGLLRASKTKRRRFKGFEWRIEPRDFINFVRECYHLYDPNKVKNKFLQEIIGSTLAAKTLTVRRVAKILGVTPQTVRRRIRKGRLFAYKGYRPNGRFRWYVKL